MARPDGAPTSAAAPPAAAGGAAGAREPRPWRARLWTWLLGTAAFILVVWALHATAAATTLVVFSVFLTLMLAPLVEWVKAKVPEKLEWLGEIAATLVLLLIALAFVGGLFIGAQQLLSAFPNVGPIDEMMTGEGDASDGEGEDDDEGPVADLGGESQARAEAIVEDMEGAAAAEGEGGAGDAQTQIEENLAALTELGEIEALGVNAADRIGELAGGAANLVLGALTETITGVVIVFFLTILMLSEARDWRARFSRILDRPERDELFETAAVIGRQLRRYLVIRAVMGVLTAALYVGWLWFAGVDLLLVWALLAFLLGFIPTLGAIISGILPVIYAFLTRDFGSALLAGAGILVIEQVTGNLIDPKLSGRYVSISPLVILVSLLVWGWIWGVPGLLLAAPMTIAISIICAHVRPLRPVALLMSNRRSMAEVDRTSTL